MITSNTASKANKRLQTVGALLCLCGTLFATGFHTAAIQAYAWSKMYSAYSETLPALQAFEKTFAGEDICGICEISQDFQQGMDESFELYLKETKPLICLILSDSEPLTPAAIDSDYGPDITKHHQEVTLTADPPPPRLA